MIMLVPGSCWFKLLLQVQFAEPQVTTFFGLLMNPQCRDAEMRASLLQVEIGFCVCAKPLGLPIA